MLNDNKNLTRFRTVKYKFSLRKFSDFRNITGWWEVGVSITSFKGLLFARQIDCTKRRYKVREKPRQREWQICF